MARVEENPDAGDHRCDRHEHEERRGKHRVVASTGFELLPHQSVAGMTWRLGLRGLGGVGDDGVGGAHHDRTTPVNLEPLEPLDHIIGRLPRDIAEEHLASRNGRSGRHRDQMRNAWARA